MAGGSGAERFTAKVTARNSRTTTASSVIFHSEGAKTKRSEALNKLTADSPPLRRQLLSRLIISHVECSPMRAGRKKRV
jgi:hypothetical protein